MKSHTIQSHASGIFFATLDNFIKVIKRITYVSNETSNVHATANKKYQLEHKSIGGTHKRNHFQTFCENITDWMLPIERDPLDE